MGRKYVPPIQGIYKITNIVNGKIYIGSSIDIKNRWWSHKDDLEHGTHCNTHLQNAWKVYGEDSFKFEILDEMNVSTREAIFKKEQEYLDLYYDGGNNCYNIAKIANGIDTSLAKIEILQLDLNGNLIKEWDSGADAERACGFLAECVYNACKGRLITYKDCKWRYKDPARAALYPEKTGQHGGHGKERVHKVDNFTFEIIETYESLEEAAKKNGINSYTAVLGCAARRDARTQNMTFRYEGYNALEDLMERKLQEAMVQKQVEENGHNKTTMCQFEDCKQIFSGLKPLASHIQVCHKMNSEEYTIKFFCNGVRPLCAAKEGCKEHTRYSTYEFKKYCKDHSHIAESAGGKKGEHYSPKDK
jgi:hypothetical protein